METPIIHSKYYTKRDMATRYGVSPLTIWRWSTQNTIPTGALVGHKMCWTPDEVRQADEMLLREGEEHGEKIREHIESLQAGNSTKTGETI